MKKHKIIWLTMVLFFISLNAGFAQTQTPTTLEQKKDQTDTIKLPSKWKLSGSIRSRYEWWDWFNPGNIPSGRDNNYPFLGNLVKIKATNERKYTDTNLEFAIPSLFFLPKNSIAPPPFGQLGLGANYRAVNRGNFTSIFLKQANLNFKGIVEKNTNVRLGRFEFADGLEYVTGDPTLDWLRKNRISQRLIGNFGFTHVQRSFDGFQVARDDKRSNITIVGARPTQGVFDLQGWGDLRNVNFLYTALSPKFQSKNSDARLFHLLYKDNRAVLKSDNRPLSLLSKDARDILINSFGGHFIQKFGPLDFLSWGTLQFGDWGKLRHKAFAYDLELGYKPKSVEMKPYFRIGRTRSSGDSNPTNGEHETFFQFLPTPRQYARFPFFNMMNLKDHFAQFLFNPRDKMTISLGYHNLRLAEPKDLWYLGGGAFQNTSFGYVGRPSNGKRTLANFLDIGVDYKVSKNLDFSFYFGHAIGEGVIRSIYPGRRGNFTYWELTRYF